MSIQMPVRIAAASFVLAATAAVLPDAAMAQANVMKECGAEYQAAKAANTLNGQKWQDFLSACRTRHAGGAPAAAAPATPPAAAPAPTAATAPAAVPKTATAPATAPATGGRAAMLQRERACGAEWKAQKVELRKTNPTLKWPQFWSQCNTRLKAAGQ